MRGIFLVILNLVLISTVQSQLQLNILPKRPYEPLVFKDLKPIWYETLYDPSFIGGDSCDGYNLFRKGFGINNLFDILFDQDYLYKFYIRNGVSQDNGTYLEKRNLRTGELSWLTYYGLPTDPYQEFGRTLSFDKNGNIEILSQLKPRPYNDKKDYSLSYLTLLSKRIYDKLSGVLIDSYLPDIQDTTLLKNKFSTWINYENFYKISQDSYQYFHYTFQLNPLIYNYVVSIITQQSKATDTVQNRLSEKENITLIPFLKIDENEILLVERELDGNRLLLRYADTKLNLIEEYYSDSISTSMSGILFNSYDPIQKTFMFTNSEESNDGVSPDLYEILILNRQGKVVKSGKMPGRYGGKFSILTGNNHSHIKLIGSENVFKSVHEINIFLDVLEMHEDGTIERVKRFTPVDSVRFITAFNIYKVLDDKILMSWWERSYSNDNGIPHFDSKSSAMSWALFNAEEFGLSTSQDNLISKEVSLYPNPTRDMIYISSNITSGGNLSIYDERGGFYKRKKIDNFSEVEIDVSFLNSGTYLIYFQPNDISSQKKYIVQKFLKL